MINGKDIIPSIAMPFAKMTNDESFRCFSLIKKLLSIPKPIIGDKNRPLLRRDTPRLNKTAVSH
jgi:hypothetical protein